MSEKDGFFYSSSDSCTSATTRTVSFESESAAVDPLPLDHPSEPGPSNEPPPARPQEQPSPEEDPSTAQMEGAYSRLTPSPKEVFPGPTTSPGPRKQARSKHSSAFSSMFNMLKGFSSIKEEKETTKGLLDSESSEGSVETLPPQPRKPVQKGPLGEGKKRSYSLPGPKPEARIESPSTASEQLLRRKSEGQIGRLKKDPGVNSPKKKSPLKKVFDKCRKTFGSKKGKTKDVKETETETQTICNPETSGKSRGAEELHEPEIAEPSTSAAGSSGVEALKDEPEVAEALTSPAGSSGLEVLEEESEHSEESLNAVPRRMRRQRSSSDREASDSPSKRKALGE